MTHARQFQVIIEGETRTDIENFLRFVQKNHPFSVVELSTDEDEYRASTLAFESEVDVDEICDFFEDNDSGETWKVHAMICPAG